MYGSPLQETLMTTLLSFSCLNYTPIEGTIDTFDKLMSLYKIKYSVLRVSIHFSQFANPNLTILHFFY